MKYIGHKESDCIEETVQEEQKIIEETITRFQKQQQKTSLKNCANLLKGQTDKAPL